jgi:hypothetical protein
VLFVCDTELLCVSDVDPDWLCDSDSDSDSDSVFDSDSDSDVLIDMVWDVEAVFVVQSQVPKAPKEA